jgi:hypothetical protein
VQSLDLFAEVVDPVDAFSTSTASGLRPRSPGPRVPHAAMQKRLKTPRGADFSVPLEDIHHESGKVKPRPQSAQLAHRRDPIVRLPYLLAQLLLDEVRIVPRGLLS